MITALFSSYLTMIVGTISSLLSVPIFLLWLGESGYGAWLLAGSLLSNLNFGSYGAQSGVVQRMAKALGRNDMPAFQRAASSGALILFCIALIIGAGVLVIQLLLPFLIREEVSQVHFRGIRAVVALLGARMAIGVALQNFGQQLFARRRMELMQGGKIIAALVTFNLTMLVVATGGGLPELAWAYFTGFLVDPLWCWFCLRRLYGGADLRIASIDRAEIGKMLHLGGWMIGNTGVNLILQNTPIFFLSSVVGLPAVTLYGVNLKLWELGRMFLIKIAAVLWPRVGERLGAGDKAGMRRQIRLIAVPSIALTSAGCGAVVMLSDFYITEWLGSGKWGGSWMVAAFFLLTILRVAKIVASTTLLGAGRVKPMVLHGLAEVAVLAVVIYPFVKLWGAPGAACALLVAALCTTAWSWTFLVADLVESPRPWMLWRAFWMFCAGAAPSMLISFILRPWAEGSLLLILSVTAVSTGVGLLSAWFLAFQPSDRLLFAEPAERFLQRIRHSSVLDEDPILDAEEDADLS